MTQDKPEKTLDQKKLVSRWVLATLVMMVAVIICLIFSWQAPAMVIAILAFFTGLVALVVTIKHRQQKRLSWAVVSFVLAFLLGVITVGIILYQSDAMLFARSAREYLDVTDTNQDFVKMTERVSASSAWKELRSTQNHYLFQHPEAWQTEVTEDEKIAAVQWEDTEKGNSVNCTVIFNLAEKMPEQTLQDYIDKNRDVKEYSSKDVTRATYTGLRTYTKNENYGFTDWFAKDNQVFSFTQLNSGGEKDACEKITTRLEESFSFISSE